MAEGATRPKASVPQPDAGHVPITEEMDSARWTLPPVLPLALVLLGLAVVVGILAYVFRAKPGAAGGITGVYTVELPDKTTMVLMHVRLSNIGSQPLWTRNFKAHLKTDQGEWTDDAASPVDYPRYFRAFPELGQHQIPPLKPETKVAAGATEEGMVLVAFPIAKDAFDKRTSLAVVVENYDRRDLVIPEKR